MAYRLKLDESFEHGFRRIAREQIDRALSELSSLEVEPAGVHETRKSIKRLRALVRLAAPSIGQKSATRRNSSLRDVARLLAARRDEAVLFETIAALERRADVEMKTALSSLRSCLGQDMCQPIRPLEAETAQKARLLLVKEAKRFAKITVKVKGFDAVRPGLEASYRTARRAHKNAYLKPTDEAFHDLRKAAQWHWRHMALLSRSWPEVVDVRASESRAVSQILGEEHDLSMLISAAKDHLAGNSSAIRSIEQHCRRQQSELRAAVKHRIARLFAEPPSAFGRRMVAYWSAGRHIRPLATAKTSNASSIVATPTAKPQDASREQGQLAATTSFAAPSQRRA
ncbi:MAG: CHAD domain-containing protein [Hyphomicrobium sp.]